MKKPMFERDFLYPTQKQFEPGSVHVTVYPPENTGTMPIVIEAKTENNPLDYISDIIGILQADVFNRIKINIKSYGMLFFKPLGDSSYYLVKPNGEDDYITKEVKNIDPLL